MSRKKRGAQKRGARRGRYSLHYTQFRLARPGDGTWSSEYHSYTTTEKEIRGISSVTTAVIRAWKKSRKMRTPAGISTAVTIRYAGRPIGKVIGE